MITSANMSLEEKIGQLFIIGIDGQMPNEKAIRLIQKYRVGGVILYRKNIGDIEQTLSLTNALKEANLGNQVPLFICTDQEGGRVSRAPKEILRIPSARQIASHNNKSLVAKSGALIGEVLASTGFNLNFAPILDLGNYKDKHAIGDRCYSNNPEIVANYGIACMKEIAAKGVVPVVKHFPGQGSAKADSHDIIIPSSPKKVNKLEETDLYPFLKAINEECDALMVGHVNLSKLNWFAPATASHKVVNGLLREKYKYDKVAITDDLCMASVVIQYGLKDLAARAIKSRNDMMIIKHPNKSESVIEYITKLVIKNKIPEEYINESVDRILKLKAKYNISNNIISSFDVEKLNKKIEDFNKEIV